MSLAPIPGYAPYYADVNGTIYRKFKRHFRPLKPSRGGNPGYCRVSICGNTVPHTHYVHRLVAAAFLGVCPPGKEVDHLNFDVSDNRVVNLTYRPIADNRANRRYAIRKRPRRYTQEQYAFIKRILVTGKYSCLDLAFVFDISYPALLNGLNRV